MRFEGLLEEGSFWVLVAAPVVWAAHFLLAYWGAAIYCARFLEAAPFMVVRVYVGAITVLALALVGWLAHHARVRYKGKLRISDDLVEDTEAERTSFLGHAALLLSALSAVAILFDALPVVVMDGCRR